MELRGETMEDKTGPQVHLVDRFCAEYGPTGISFKSYHKLAINSRLIHHTCMISWKQLSPHLTYTPTKRISQLKR